MMRIPTSSAAVPKLVSESNATARQAATPCLGTTETIHRIGVLDLSSLTERTIPVTGKPRNITVALWPRYWA